MNIDNAKQYQDRKKHNLQFNSYLPKFLGIPFKAKLEKDNKKFSEWLKDNVERYLKKN